MTKHLTGRFSKVALLLVGVCLIGTAFHVHQLHPDYSLQNGDIPQHISIDKPDCVACMSFVQAVPPVYDDGNLIQHDFLVVSLLVNPKVRAEFVSERNNKSPPA